MRENPVRGFEAPREKNPRRPVATQDRYEAIRRVSDRVTMGVAPRRRGRRWEYRKVRSYLSEILDIVNGTGRRISAACSLRYRDLRLNDGTPHGSIRWPADTDKEGTERTVPISPTVRRALDRITAERPGIGGAPLFPSPLKQGEPIRYELASAWLREAEKLAGLEPLKGSLWHAYRRGWATARKHLPAVDVAEAGGWAGPQTMQASYQHADRDTMLRVVLEAGELREAK
jgi:integrase